MDGSMTGSRFAHFRAPRVAATLLFVLIAGCTARHDLPKGAEATLDENPVAQTDFRVLTDAYSFIGNVYVEEIGYPELALASLEGLQELDPDAEVAVVGDKLTLTFGPGRQATIEQPEADATSLEWGWVTTRMLDSARRLSPALAKADAEMVRAAVFKGIGTRLDPYSHYATPRQADRDRAWRDGYEGIGIEIDKPGDDIVIVSVFRNTPAALAGLRANEVIVRVDGASIAGLEIEEAVKVLRGPRDSDVVLTLRDPETGAIRNVTVRRAHIDAPTVQFARHDAIGVIIINGFNNATATTVREAMEKIEDMPGPRLTGLVLDLRDNRGGYLNIAVDTADLFLNEGTIMSSQGRRPEASQHYEANFGDITGGLPIVVLVNGNSASAAEILAAALQDQGRAVLVGSLTFGKGSVQNVHELPNDGELSLTWARLHAPSGYSWSGGGIMPNICTSRAEEGPVEALMQEVSRQLDAFRELRRRQHEAGPDDPEMRDALDEACPAVRDLPEADLDIARELIAAPAVYQAARIPPSPRIAASR